RILPPHRLQSGGNLIPFRREVSEIGIVSQPPHLLHFTRCRTFLLLSHGLPPRLSNLIHRSAGAPPTRDRPAPTALHLRQRSITGCRHVSAAVVGRRTSPAAPKRSQIVLPPPPPRHSSKRRPTVPAATARKDKLRCPPPPTPASAAGKYSDRTGSRASPPAL